MLQHVFVGGRYALSEECAFMWIEARHPPLRHPSARSNIHMLSTRYDNEFHGIYGFTLTIVTSN